MSAAHRKPSSLVIHEDGVCREGCTHRAPDAEQVGACRAWLRKYAQPRKTMNLRTSSYGLKHDVERDSDDEVYVSNGALIKAALFEGYRIEQIGDGPNVRLNIALPTHPEHSRSAKRKSRRRSRVALVRWPRLRLIVGGLS